MRVVVAGGSVGGLAAALALSRRGHEVVVIERDDAHHSEWQSAFESKRSVAQFRLPHVLLARARKVLAQNAPDVLAHIAEAGGIEIDMCRKIPHQHRDADLVATAARRPLLEWALTRALESDGRVQVRPRTAIRGLGGRATSSGPPVIEGVVTSEGETIPADLVVDALGRSSAISRWVAELGTRVPEAASSDCGAIGYSRYFRFLPDVPLPEMTSALGAVGDTGYMGFNVMWGDNRVFSVGLSVPAWDKDLRVLRGEPAFMAAARAIPVLDRLIDPSRSEAITPILTMGRQRNIHRTFLSRDVPVALGLLAIGDALCNTNSAYAFGISLALMEAFWLADVIEGAQDLTDLAVRFHEVTHCETRERYRIASETDDARIRRWRGELLDSSSPNGNLPLFMLGPLGVAGRADPEIYGKFMRRWQVLDLPGALENDQGLLSRASQIYRDRISSHPPNPFPEREVVLAAAEDAMSTR